MKKIFFLFSVRIYSTGFDIELVENVNIEINLERNVENQNKLLKQVYENLKIWKTHEEMNHSINANYTLIRKIYEENDNSLNHEEILLTETYRQELFMGFTFIKNQIYFSDNKLDVDVYQVDFIRQNLSNICNKVFFGIFVIIQHINTYIKPNNSIEAINFIPTYRTPNDYRESTRYSKKLINFYGELISLLRQFILYYSLELKDINYFYLNANMEMIFALNNTRLYSRAFFKHLNGFLEFKHRKINANRYERIVFEYLALILSIENNELTEKEEFRNNIIKVINGGSLTDKKQTILKMLFNHSLYNLQPKQHEEYAEYSSSCHNKKGDELQIRLSNLPYSLLLLDFQEIVCMEEYKDYINFNYRPLYKIYTKNPIPYPVEFDNVNYIIHMNYLMKDLWAEIREYYKSYLIINASKESIRLERIWRDFLWLKQDSSTYHKNHFIYRKNLFHEYNYFFTYIRHVYIFISSYNQIQKDLAFMNNYKNINEFINNSKEVNNIIFNLFKDYQEFFISKDKKYQVTFIFDDSEYFYPVDFLLLFIKDAITANSLNPLNFIYNCTVFAHNFPPSEDLFKIYNNFIFAPLSIWLNCSKVKSCKNNDRNYYHLKGEEKQVSQYNFQEDKFSQFMLCVWHDLKNFEEFFPTHIFWNTSFFTNNLSFICEQINYENKTCLYLALLKFIINEEVLCVENIAELYLTIIEQTHEGPFVSHNDDYLTQDMYIMSNSFLKFLKENNLRKLHKKNEQNNKLIYKEFLLKILEDLLAPIVDGVNNGETAPVFLKEFSEANENINRTLFLEDEQDKMKIEKKPLTSSQIRKRMYRDLFKKTYTWANELCEQKQITYKEFDALLKK
jgi:hypothetical protein